MLGVTYVINIAVDLSELIHNKDNGHESFQLCIITDRLHPLIKLDNKLRRNLNLKIDALILFET